MSVVQWKINPLSQIDTKTFLSRPFFISFFGSHFFFFLPIAMWELQLVQVFQKFGFQSKSKVKIFSKASIWLLCRGWEPNFLPDHMPPRSSSAPHTVPTLRGLGDAQNLQSAEFILFAQQLFLQKLIHLMGGGQLPFSGPSRLSQQHTKEMPFIFPGLTLPSKRAAPSGF